MSSPQHCLAMADEADRLAGIVSYERDKVRLRDQAAAWRQMAGAMTAPPAAAVLSEVSEPSALAQSRPAPPRTGWLRRRFG